MHTAIIMTTAGPLYMRKSKNDKPAAEPIMMLGGSPISVAVPPTLDAMISVMKKGMGLMLSMRQTVNVTGPMSSTVVTLSKKAERTAVINENRIMMIHGLPFASFVDLMARYSKMPEYFTTATNIIMPTSTPSVLKSMCSMPVSKLTMPSRMRTTAPASAAVARWTFSETTRAITTTNTTIEMICAVVRAIMRGHAPCRRQAMTHPSRPSRAESEESRLNRRCSMTIRQRSMHDSEAHSQPSIRSFLPCACPFIDSENS